MANSNLKLFVNNKDLWDAFLVELDDRITFCHKQLEQIEDLTYVYRIQGEIKQLRSLKMLRDKVNV